MNDTNEKYLLNVDVSNFHKTVQKYARSHENSNEYIIANPKGKFLLKYKFEFWYKE